MLQQGRGISINFANLFEDDAAHSHKRQQYMSDHLAFLKRNASRISAAGPPRNPRWHAGSSRIASRRLDQAE